MLSMECVNARPRAYVMYQIYSESGFRVNVLMQDLIPHLVRTSVSTALLFL